MDRELPARIGSLVGVAVAGLRDEGTQHGLRHLTGTLADGRAVFVKAADDGGAPDAFAAEANGLRWLADAGAVPVPAVLGADERTLVIGLLPPGSPTPQAARDLGAGLARLHAAGAAALGAPWPGRIASLPLDNRPLDNTVLFLGHAYPARGALAPRPPGPRTPRARARRKARMSGPRSPGRATRIRATTRGRTGGAGTHSGGCCRT